MKLSNIILANKTEGRNKIQKKIDGTNRKQIIKW